MTGRTIFFKRIREAFQFQWKVIRSVLDLTNMMYTIVPALIIGFLIYVQLWQDIHSYWHKEIPFFVLIGIILLLLLWGNFRTFLREADILFLIQRTSLFNKLKLWSFHYSLLQLILGTAFLIILILPILSLAYGLSRMEIVVLFTILLAYRLLMLTMKKLLIKSLYRWAVLSLLFFITVYFILMLDGFLLMTISILTIFGVYYFYFSHFVKTKRYFLQEIVIEQREKVKYIKIIFGFSMEVEKAPTSSANKPSYSRHAKRIFRVQNKENGLLEFLLKAFLRNKIYFSSYIQLMVATVFALFILPVWLKWVLFICFILFMNHLLKNIYNRMLDHPFFGVVPYDRECIPNVWTRFKRWIFIPSFILVGGLALLFSFLEFFVGS
ncbi:ABC transporter permease [Virgibacillus ainsalahensis]